ncbi:hypothetical protein M9H77_18503 [Catharanthus roseus]|uniref:Uncharacterized protein n=1 Tax=Catharanthus roseus TaxID=4058 RepID=A0ACC0B7M8_CATRO|nr:hypothetical protein M9H77_18503 [Catharanthus roseus]
MVVLPLSSPVGFCLAMLGNLIPTANGRFPLPSTVGVNELPQAQEVLQGSAKIHIEEETSEEDSCDHMRDKNIKKKIEIREKDRAGEKERLYKNTRTYLWTMPISLGHPYTLTSMLGRSHTLELEDQEVNVCAISFGGGHFLVVSSTSKCLSFHASLMVSLLNSGAKFDPSCHGFGMLDDVSFVDPNIFCSELVNFAYHPFKEVMFQTTDLLDLFIKFIKETSFCYHLAFKDISLNPFLEEFSKKLFLSNFISNVLLKDFEGTLLLWKLEWPPNFMFLILQSLENLSFQFHRLFRDIVENAVNMCHLQYFYTFTSAFLGRSLVISTCFFHSPSVSHLVFNFFDYNSFPYHRPFKEF